MTDTSMPSTRRLHWLSSRKACILVAISIFAFGSCLASRTTLFERLETTAPLAALEMARSASWMTPHSANGLAEAVSPLSTWLTSASMGWLGVGSWSARLPSVLALALAALALFFTARRLHGGRAGVFAMLVFASSPLTLALGSLATPEMLECACFTGLLLATTDFVTAGASNAGTIGMAATVALQLLVAGPRGMWTILLGLAAMLLLLARWHEAIWPRVPALVLAVLGGGALYLTYAIPANEVGSGALAALWSDPFEPWRWVRTGFDPRFAVVALMLGFLPWIALLGPALTHARARREHEPQPFAIVAGFGLPLFLLFAASGARRMADLALLLPIVALALAGWFEAERLERVETPARARLERGGWILALLSVALVLIVLAIPSRVGIGGLERGAQALALLALGSALGWWHCFRSERWSAFLKLGVVANALVACATSVFLLRPLEEQKQAPRLMNWIRESATRDAPIVLYGVKGELYDFHAAPGPGRLVDDFDLHAFSVKHGPAVLVLPRPRALAERAWFSADRWREIASVSGSDERTGKTTEIVAIGRDLPTQVP